MIAWPKDNDVALDAYFGGRPDGSAKWEVKNLTYIFLPWKGYLAGTKIELARGIRVHNKVAADLTAILKEIWANCGKSQAEIAKCGLDQIGGTYFFRVRRGSNRVSNHGRGIAIDLDPLHNAMVKGNRGHMAASVILAFQRHGWRWGGEYGDPMHFEAVQSPVSNAIAKAWESNPVVPKPVKISNLFKEEAKWTIPQAAFDLIKQQESYVGHAYNDRGSLAIGYGHTSKIGPPAVNLGDTMTEPQAANLLVSDVTTLVGTIMPFIKAHASPNELGAFASFTYNLGQNNFASSTLLKKFNAGDKAGAANEFLKWNKSTNPETHVKEVLPGLTKRRAKERELFLT